MKNNQIYSSSLKKMLGYKIFQDIQPEQIKIERNKIRELSYLQNSKSSKELKQLKRQLAQNSKKRQGFQKQIEKIVSKIGAEDHRELGESKLNPKSYSRGYRIATEPVQYEQKKITLPTLSMNTRSYKNLTRRTKTLQSEERDQKKEREQIVNVGRLIRHYRAGMSSLRKLKVHSNY